MSYQALYRVWRPQTFNDVVGQVHITRTLQNAIYQNKFSHAYLFSGPRGTGKTSAAKIFAKAVNCQSAPVKEPCGKCDACIGIQDGTISDVIEIDAASNNGVEQIRDIRDKVKYAPSVVDYKVYIIDEVHMLSIGAFNALLKTLEEPPQHVIFILATTEPHKIPLTIISRCQRFDFKRIGHSFLVERMKQIMNEEKISVTDEAFHAIALAAEGGMRDALSLLDQAISYSQDVVELEDVLAITGSVSQSNLIELIDALYHQDAKTALKLVDLFIQEGKDPGRLVYDLIYFLRDLLIYQDTTDSEDLLERAIVDQAFKELQQKLTSNWIQNSITELNQCQQEMKWTNTPKVFIEITVLKIADQQAESKSSVLDDKQLLQLTEKLDKLEKELQSVKQNYHKASEPVKASAPSNRRSPGVTKNKYKIPYERIRDVLAHAEKQYLTDVQQKWPTFMNMLKQQSAPAHAVLQDAKPSAASADRLVIAFRYDIHCSLALDHQQLIESLLLEILGKVTTFIPIPEQSWVELRQEYVEKQRQQSQEVSSNQTVEDPIVAQARKLVGDDLLEIHE
ncbi:DNA polymerase III subunit gamma/tau [Amphibacillus xylanus]|uniref:DNA-directed DNA polymerase n=1 Tax=Amphibacillus xylanus (strain ATCC 51415 / DSM 6626 / JCM 7361 / LMG 17667 / NBRC 15112 / Ep01) TaxID=698758 RepID=K0J119_AMPXN|nr:DNA polymerase III subunit gamma/tau [Amphibacillus xylanus]BAM46151.1 DNA polymerase III subunit tau [Amphibacillus xylanus NBRC 15112]